MTDKSIHPDIPATDWGERIAAGRRQMAAARAAHEQTIRDAVESGMSIAEIARALQTKDRTGIYAILGKARDGGTPIRPAHTPTVYLRGAGRSDDTWACVQTAMWARGWATVSDRTTAWHLARGGVPVVLVDFSTDLDATEWPSFGYDRYVSVWRVRAVWRVEEADPAVLERTLGTDAPVPYRRVADDGIRAGTLDGKNAVDEHVLAGLVADAFDHGLLPDVGAGGSAVVR